MDKEEEMKKRVDSKVNRANKDGENGFLHTFMRSVPIDQAELFFLSDL